jgi:hypothetical protein
MPIGWILLKHMSLAFLVGTYLLASATVVVLRRYLLASASIAFRRQAYDQALTRRLCTDCEGIQYSKQHLHLGQTEPSVLVCTYGAVRLSCT